MFNSLLNASKSYNTCLNLFGDIYSPEKIAELMSELGGESWRSGDFKVKLGTRLREHAINNFLGTVNALNDILGELIKKILKERGKVCYIDETWQQYCVELTTKPSSRNGVSQSASARYSL